MTGKILVVDDEVDVQTLIERRFRREIRQGEFHFVFAHDGEEALDVLHSQPDIDVVLSDINMPGMDGLELLRHIGEIETHLKTVMVSAYGDMPNIRTAMNHGAFDFLTKPIDFTDLSITIKKTLDELDLMREAFRQRSEAERAKANLARYFAPALVETLAETDDPFGSPREQQVAVLFADMIGFTSLCARQSPEKTFTLLREFHQRLAAQVFAADGTLDKYIGDGLMATFGTPDRGQFDATNALRCATAMVRTIDDLNRQRRESGEPEVGVAIGIHYGRALLGNVGDERRLEFATIGDTVNIASRLEQLARRLDAVIVASSSLIEGVRSEGSGCAAELADLRQQDSQIVRGIDVPMTVWTLARRAGPE